MEEQDFLHRLKVKSGVNQDLLRNLYHNEMFLDLIRSDQLMDAMRILRSAQPILGMREVKTVVEEFSLHAAY